MASGKFEITGQGIVYRNPKVHVKSIHAYFPSLVDLGHGELLCLMMLAQAFESDDARLYLARSHDYGDTWTLEGQMLPEPSGGRFSESGRISLASDGTVVAVVFRYDRHRVGEGMANPETLGFVETTIHTCRSTDKGRTWSDLAPVDPAIVGPQFELCSPIVELSNGDWVLPSSTLRRWNGYDPTGVKAIAFISRDRGGSWPECSIVMDGSSEGTVYWESKVVELDPGWLLSVAWAYDERNARDLPNVYSISTNGGRTFSEPASTGLQGQTPAILPLGNDKVLCVYRRVDEVGMWAAIASVAGDRWETLDQAALWGAPSVTVGSQSDNMVENFNVLRFGAPDITRLDNGDIFTVFWCVEDSVSNIRWIRSRRAQATLAEGNRSAESVGAKG